MATPPDRPLRAPGRLARFGELRAGIQPARLALRSPSLRGRALRTRHVILLPGFGTTDRALVPLRSYLRSLGHQAHGWDIGRHGKDVESSVERFLPVVERRVDAAGEPVVGRPVEVLRHEPGHDACTIGPAVSWSGTTDDAGFVLMEGVPAGRELFLRVTD